MPVHWVPLWPPFSKWYNTNVQCDYHAGNSSHLTENCNSLKREVQSLIKDGKLKFEESNGPVGVEDPSRAKTKMRRQEKEASREASSWKTTMPRDKILVVKIKKNEARCLVTIERSK